MSKERLEAVMQIRKNMQEFVDSNGYVEDYQRYDEQALFIVDDGHLDWLIKQAEQVQEWKGIAQWQNDEKIRIEKHALELEKQNKRYREVVTQAIRDLENECLWDALVKLKALEGEE